MSNRTLSPSQVKGYWSTHRLEEEEGIKHLEDGNNDTSSTHTAQPFRSFDSPPDNTIKGYRTRRTSYRSSRLPSTPENFPIDNEQLNRNVDSSSLLRLIADAGLHADIDQAIEDILLNCALSPTSEHFVGPDGFPLRVEVEINKYRDGAYSTTTVDKDLLPMPLSLASSKGPKTENIEILPTVNEVGSMKDLFEDKVETSLTENKVVSEKGLHEENIESSPAEPEFTTPTERRSLEHIMINQKHSSNFDFGNLEQWDKWEPNRLFTGPSEAAKQARLHDAAEVRSMIASIHETSPPASPPVPPKKHLHDKPLPPIPENNSENMGKLPPQVTHTPSRSLYLRRLAIQSGKHSQNKSMPSLPLGASPSRSEVRDRERAELDEAPPSASMYEKEVCYYEVHPAYRAEPIQAPLIFSNADVVSPLPQPNEIKRHHQRIASSSPTNEPLPTSPLLGNHQGSQRIFSGFFSSFKPPLVSPMGPLLLQVQAPLVTSPVNEPLPPSINPHEVEHDNSSFIDAYFSTNKFEPNSPGQLIGGFPRRRRSPESMRMHAKATEDIHNLQRLEKPRHRRIHTAEVQAHPKLIPPNEFRRLQGVKTFPMKRKTSALKRTSVLDYNELMIRERDRQRDSGDSFFTETTGSEGAPSHGSSFQSLPTTITPRSSDPIDPTKTHKHTSSSVYSSDNYADSLASLIPAPITDPSNPRFKGKGRDLNIHPPIVRSQSDLLHPTASSTNTTHLLPRSQTLSHLSSKQTDSAAGKMSGKQHTRTMTEILQSPSFKTRLNKRKGSVSNMYKEGKEGMRGLFRERRG